MSSPAGLGYSGRPAAEDSRPPAKCFNALERLIEMGTRVAREAMGDRDFANDPRTALVIGTSKGPADDWLIPVDSSQKPTAPPSDGTNGHSTHPTPEPPTSDKPSNSICEDVPSGPDIRSCEEVASIRECEDVTPGRFIPLCEVVTIRPDIRYFANISIVSGPEYGLATLQTQLAADLGVIGSRLTVSAACASSLHALIRAAMLLQHGDADRAIVIGVESSLHPAFIESFKRLGVIANPGGPCRPMDERRSGFLLSEAAACVILERRKAQPGEITLDGYAIGADASHLTHTDANALALKYMLTRVMAGRSPDLIHAHATGTVANDAIELTAIESVLSGVNVRPDQSASVPPTIYSHKGALGHTLGASGLVAAVLNVMSHRHGTVPGNVNTAHPLRTTAGRIEQASVKRAVRQSLIIAAGFGGATGVVGLRTAE